jgi:molybdopterin-synthase adenylyltransferase
MPLNGKGTFLESMAHRISRGGQETLVVADHALLAWAASRGFPLPQAFETALTAGIFPESLERNFPALHAREQLRLFRSRVLVAGLGGLGGFQAMLLARLGIGRLLLADGDVFTPSNLNRQIFATARHLGLHKALVTAQHLKDIHPALIVEPVDQFLTPENLPHYLAQVQVALDGLDNLPARKNLFAAAQAARVPLVHGAVHGLFGQVATILPQDAGSFEKIYPGARLSAPGPPEVLAPVVSLIASLQVQEAVRLLLRKPPAYHNVLAYFDGDTGRLDLLPLG